MNEDLDEKKLFNTSAETLKTDNPYQFCLLTKSLLNSSLILLIM